VNDSDSENDIDNDSDVERQSMMTASDDESSTSYKGSSFRIPKFRKDSDRDMFENKFLS
jgi:hypothetical protein